MGMKIAVCDDQPFELKELKKLLDELPEAETVHLYADIDAFFAAVRAGHGYDAVLMDIQWDSERTGIDFSRELLEVSPATGIIYITAYPKDYVEDIFLQQSNLSGFLMKPVKKEMLERNLQKLISGQKDMEEHRLVVRAGRRFLTIPFHQIRYLENQLHKTRIVTADGESLCSESLEEVRERLDGRFLRCHKSFVVNMEYVREISRTSVLLLGGEELPVSKSKSGQVRSRFVHYMGERLVETS